MSDLRSLIQESRAAKVEMVASTIRMPKDTNSFIEELAEHLLLSKQEVMLKLIEEGIKIAKSELNVYTQGENCKFHLLNTNRRYDVNDQDDMITNEIAAAFYAPWKYNIDRIEKDDIVFLYENGVGIVAYGTATGDTKKKDRHGDKDECHYQKLTDFHVLKKPITAAETKKILNRNVVFLRTMSAMPDGQKILNRITGK